MTDQLQTAREDLAFLKGIAEDKDPLPWGFGANLLAPGLLYAPGGFLAWASLSGLIAVPTSWLVWSWVPATLIYVPTLIVLSRGNRAHALGPNKKVFAAAWTAMGAMSIAVLLALAFAPAGPGLSFWMLWPPIAFALYGGTWTVIGMTHRRLWHGLVALGCFTTTLLCAALIGSPLQWLAMGAGILLWIAGPGLIIIYQSSRARSV